MSFEGYYQILCRNGHVGGVDCYGDLNFDGPEKTSLYQGHDVGEEYDHPLWRCTECKELAGWWNLVNTTNGSYYEGERIDGYVDLKVAIEPDVCTCKCGCVHLKGGKPPTYHIPREGGHTVNGGLRDEDGEGERI